MWQRFTERARRVVFFAQEEADRLGENYVSTEHLLLGLVRENDSVAARILDRIGVSLRRVRSEIEKQVARGDGRLGQDMQLTPRAKRVIDLAYDEARQLNNNYIGTEHLLLGLIREGEGLAGRVLSKLGVDLERTRREVTALQDAEPGKDPSLPSKAELLDRVQTIIRQLLHVDPALAALPDAALLEALTGGVEAARKAAAEVRNASNDAEIVPEVGDLGILKNANGREQGEIAVDAEALLELAAVIKAKDHHGYDALVASGRVLLVSIGCELKRLKPLSGDTAAANTRGYFVRILSGEHVAKAGWVPRGAFQRTGPDTTPFPPPLRAEGDS